MMEVNWLLQRYEKELEAPSRGLHLKKVPEGWLLTTKPVHEDVVAPARSERGALVLSAVALETLAAVALRQPVTTRDVNRERGRDSGALLKTLQKRGLIIRTPSPGIVGLWRTTTRFLTLTGIESLDELYQTEVFHRIFGNAKT